MTTRPAMLKSTMVRLGAIALWPALTAALGVIGFWLINTTFMVYDDEGYVLIGYKNFAAGHLLYREVFSQYGPVPFLYHEFWHRLTGWPLGHEFGRFVTLVHWVGASLACGWVAWRSTDQRWTAWWSTVLSFGFLWPMTSEPSHPGGLITAIIAGGLAMGVEAERRNRTNLTAIILGCSGGLLLLTKINVGLLWCAAAVAFLALNTESRGRWSSWRVVIFSAFTLMPFLLMAPLLRQGWVLSFAGCFAVCAALALALMINRPGIAIPVARRAAFVAGLALLASMMTVLLLMGLRGSSLADLIEGILLGPLRHPTHFSQGMRWPSAAWAALAGSVLLVGAWLGRPRWHEALRPWIAGARLLFLGILAWHAPAWMTQVGLSHMMVMALPLAPLFLIPLAPVDAPRRQGARHLAMLLGLGQILHAYPVAGSQMAWGTFLMLPSLVAGVAEVIGMLNTDPLRRTLRGGLIAAIAVMASVQGYLLGRTAWERWDQSLPLDLPHATSLRLPESLRGPLRILSLNATLHADMLYSLPGMFSFNLWADLPTPTRHNATHWFWLLDDTRQREIVEHLSATRRSALIINRPLERFIADHLNIVIEGPLVDALAARHTSLFTLAGYDFQLPAGQAAVPFFLMRHYEREPGITATGYAQLIEVNVVAEAELTAAEFRDWRVPPDLRRRLDATNSRVAITPITVAGQPLGPEESRPWPVRLHGAYRLRIHHDDHDIGPHPHRQLVFLDDTGTAVGEAWPLENP